MFRTLTVCILSLSLLLLAAGGSAMIQTLPLSELIAGSELIVVGTCTATHPVPAVASEPATAENQVAVTEVLKGLALSGVSLTVITPVGFEDEVKLSASAPAVLFLVPGSVSGTWEVNNLVQGHWPLDEKGEPLGMGLGTSLETLRQAIASVAAAPPAEPGSGSAPAGDAL